MNEDDEADEEFWNQEAFQEVRCFFLEFYAG